VPDWLNDKRIIGDCSLRDPNNFPLFLTNPTREKVQEFIIGCKNDYLPEKEGEKLNKLWTSLLSDAITFLKTKDKRENPSGSARNRDSIAFGVDELSKYFQEYNAFEALLYSDRFYRDHVMHVFRVWLVGIWILRRTQSVYFDNQEFNEKISRDEIDSMWCIIALTHDLGYPLDKFEKVTRRIDSMMTYFGGNQKSDTGFRIPSHHHFINDFILTFISSKLVKRETEKIDPSKKKSCKEEPNFQTAKQSKFYLKFSKSFEVFDHGIISCILLMKNLVYFLESDLDLSRPFTDNEDARQFYIRREILRSIASHTCTDIYHLYPNSLAFILILADELQVWKRPTFYALKASGGQELSLNAQVPSISEKVIELAFEVVATKDEKASQKECQDYVFALFRKWQKWLRSALGASERKFEVTITCRVKAGRTTTEYQFKSRPQEQPKLLINAKKRDLIQIWSLSTREVRAEHA